MLGDELYSITALFAEQLTTESDRLSAQIAAADWPGLGRSAHALKGSSGNMGAMALAQLALQLEKQAKAEEADAIAASAAELPGLIDQTLAAMRAAGFLRD